MTDNYCITLKRSVPLKSSSTEFSYSFFPIAIFPSIDKTSKRVIPLFLIWKMEISLKWKSRKKDEKSLDKHENNKQKNCSYIYTQYDQCLWKNIPSKTKLKPYHIWIMEASLFATLTISLFTMVSLCKNMFLLLQKLFTAKPLQRSLIPSLKSPAKLLRQFHSAWNYSGISASTDWQLLTSLMEQIEWNHN